MRSTPLSAAGPADERTGTQAPAARFEAIFERHARAVYRLCARRTGHFDLAHDLTSITFL